MLWDGLTSAFKSTPVPLAASAEQPPMTMQAAPATAQLEDPATAPDIEPEETRKPTKPKSDPLAIARKRILLKACRPETIAALEKGNGITVPEAFDVYFDLKLQGYGEFWEKSQKPDKEVGKKWKGSTLPGMRVAKNIWSDLLSKRTIGNIPEEDVLEAIPVIRVIPTLHGKSEELSSQNGYRDLVKRVELRDQIRMDKCERDMRKAGVTDLVEIEAAKIETQTDRLRAETYFKHVRAINRVGKMLLKLGIIAENPFIGCTFTNQEEKRIKATERTIARQRWDDRLDDFFQTRMFQGNATGPRDTLFWIPLLAYLMGLRSEEALQLEPADFSTQGGIPYLKVQNDIGNNVKSGAGERVIPVHPALIELGLLDLVDTCRREGKARLFGDLKRGKTKGTFTEIFTKSFTRYRQDNDVYWHGLDLHALRTTFHHELMDNSTPGYIKRHLMGHEPLDEGEKSYAQGGISLNTLLEHVSAVPFRADRVISPIKSVEARRSQARDVAPKLKLVK